MKKSNYAAFLLSACLGLVATKSYAVDIDLSGSTATVGNQKIILKQVVVPGLGTYDAEFTWDGAGSFKLSGATPSQPAPSAGRTCRLTSTGGYVDMTVKSNVLELTAYSTSNDSYFFPLAFNIKQGVNSSAISILDYMQGKTFLWTNADGFVGGQTPAGTQISGSVAWRNTWFNSSSPFSVIASTGESWNC